MGAHRLVEHVSEVELELEGASEADLFMEAAAAFRDLVDGGGARGDQLRHEIALGPSDADLLLADWLNELVFLAEVEGFVPFRVVGLDLRRRRLRATVEGARSWPRHFVKAATLHGLRLVEDREGWHGRVLLDV